MEMNRREMLKLSASGVVAAGTIGSAAAQATKVDVPTCPTEVFQPEADVFKEGPILFRQIPVEPLTIGTPPAHWDGVKTPKVGEGPCGIAKEFGTSDPDGKAVPEYLDDDDPSSTTLAGLLKEASDARAKTEYYEVFIQRGKREILRPGPETEFLGYGCCANGDYADGNAIPANAPSVATFPGPMFQARVGRPMVIRFVNEVNDYMSVHLHGAHGPAHSDGHPAFVVPKAHDAGFESEARHAPPTAVRYWSNHRDYYYPHTVPGEGDGKDRAKLDFSESPSTMWYHDHSMDVTGPHVMMGLAGFFPAFDDHELSLLANRVLPFLRPKVPLPPKDTDDTREPVFAAARTNLLDLSLVLQDRCFAAAGDRSGAPENALLYSVKGHNGFLGHRVLVNGLLHPRSVVFATKYRLRILNGSNARIYKLGLFARKEDAAGNAVAGADGVLKPLRGRLPADSPEWFRIGKDTWLYPHAIRQHKVLLGMAARAEMIVDFQAIQEAAKRPANNNGFFESPLVDGDGHRVAVYLCNLLDQESGRGPKLKLPDGNAQELTFGSDNKPIAIAPARDVLPDGDTQRAELAQPWPLLKFTVTTDVNEIDTAIAKGIEQGTCQPMLKKFTDLEFATPFPHATVTLGTRLREHFPIQPWEIQRTREVVFERGNGIWQINGKVVDEFLSNFVPQLNSAECWILENGGGGWWHPIHIHVESHQQIEYLEELELGEFKLVIGQIIATYKQAVRDEATLGNVTHARDLGEILKTLRETLSPVQTKVDNPDAPVNDRGLARDANDEVSLQKLTRRAVKALVEWVEKRGGLGPRPDSDQLVAWLRLQKAYGGVADLIEEFDPEIVFEDHRLWSRISIPEWDRYKSDTTLLGPNTRVKIFIKFRTFDGPFVFHCHNLEHEDMRMMFVVDPRPTPPPSRDFAEALTKVEAADPQEAARMEMRRVDDYHLREHVTRYRHPWRFDDDPDFDEAAHVDAGSPAKPVKNPPWNVNPVAGHLARAHPIWGGWDQHL